MTNGSSATAESPGLADDTAMRRRLTQFSAASLLLSWIPWIALGALGANIDEGVALLVFGLAASGPSLAALGMWLRYRRTERMPRQVTWSPVWPLVAVIAGGAPAVLAALLVGAEDIPHHAASVISDVGGPLAALAYTFLAGPLAEEFGWRGYMQPRFRRYFGRIATTLVLSVAWGVWHLPLYFLTGTGQHDDGLFSQAALVFFLGLIPLSYTILFLSEGLRGGVWAAVLVHAAFNLSEALVPSLSSVGRWTELLLMTLVAVAAAMVWRRFPGSRSQRLAVHVSSGG